MPVTVALQSSVVPAKTLTEPWGSPSPAVPVTVPLKVWSSLLKVTDEVIVLSEVPVVSPCWVTVRLWAAEVEPE